MRRGMPNSGLISEPFIRGRLGRGPSALANPGTPGHDRFFEKTPNSSQKGRNDVS
jgi:hypothetical protein